MAETKPATLHVLTYGECDAEVLGVFDTQEDARNFAEAKEGSALAWYEGRLSQDYKVLEVPYVTHDQASADWLERTKRELGLA